MRTKILLSFAMLLFAVRAGADLTAASKLVGPLDGLSLTSIGEISYSPKLWKYTREANQLSFKHTVHSDKAFQVNLEKENSKVIKSLVYGQHSGGVITNFSGNGLSDTTVCAYSGCLTVNKLICDRLVQKANVKSYSELTQIADFCRANLSGFFSDTEKAQIKSLEGNNINEIKKVRPNSVVPKNFAWESTTGMAPVSLLFAASRLCQQAGTFSDSAGGPSTTSFSEVKESATTK